LGHTDFSLLFEFESKRERPREAACSAR
jgi:hypothetical protein